MGDRRATTHREREIAALAAAQFGIVDVPYLASLGVDKRGAWRRERRGQLHRLHVGVYSIVPPSLLRAEGHWLAATRAAGPTAVLSHRAAAALWELRNVPSGPVDVAVPSASGRRPRVGMVVHRCAALRAEDVTEHRGLAVTTVARTLRDLKRVLAPARFEDLLRRAVDRRMDTGGLWPSEVEERELERRFLALCRRHRLPRPRTQQVIGPFTVDFLWPAARLVAETDGFAPHGARSRFESDRARDAWLATRGYRVIRFTWRQLTADAPAVVATLHQLLDIC